MSETKFTPGPWQWAQNRANERYPKKGRWAREGFVYLLLGPGAHGNNADSGKPVDPFDDCVMALRWYSVKGDVLYGATPGPANAALIAAAPELYAVAQRHAEYLLAELSRMGQPTAGHICGPDGNCDSDCEARYYLTADLEAARAALAKARGE